EDLADAARLQQLCEWRPEGIDSFKADIGKRAQMHQAHGQASSDNAIHLVEQRAKSQWVVHPSQIIGKNDIQVPTTGTSVHPEPAGDREAAPAGKIPVQTQRLVICSGMPVLVAPAIGGAGWVSPPSAELRRR